VLEQLLGVFLASLRIAPMIAFAPPFTLISAPAVARAAVVVALALAMPGAHVPVPTDAGPLVAAALGELLNGIVLALPLQLAFALLGMAGRALDIQAGFGLAFVLDPKTRAQTPLVGALFAYAAAALFFLTSGPTELVGILSASFLRLPLGSVAALGLASFASFVSVAAVLSLGAVGLGMLALFLIDLVIAALSRTLPQMNVLVLGFQVKSIATLVLLPVVLAWSSAAILRILRLALEATARMA
jgi:flagellar biosynthetic protein FliR